MKQFDNMKGYKKQNTLVVINIQDYLKSYRNNCDYYKSVFSILKELEDAVIYTDEPDQHIFIEYKPDFGNVLFKYVGSKPIFKDILIHYYEFISFAS